MVACNQYHQFGMLLTKKNPAIGRIFFNLILMLLSYDKKRLVDMLHAIVNIDEVSSCR